MPASRDSFHAQRARQERMPVSSARTNVSIACPGSTRWAGPTNARIAFLESSAMPELVSVLGRALPESIVSEQLADASPVPRELTRRLAPAVALYAPLASTAMTRTGRARAPAARRVNFLLTQEWQLVLFAGLELIQLLPRSLAKTAHRESFLV
jgi:hypothetical protein